MKLLVRLYIRCLKVLFYLAYIVFNYDVMYTIANKIDELKKRIRERIRE